MTKAPNTSLYTKRFDGDTNFFAWMEEVFKLSKAQKGKSNVLSAREAVEAALDSNWNKLAENKTIEAGRSLPPAKRLYPNILLKYARMAGSEWIQSGLIVEPNTQSHDQIDKDLAEASKYLFDYQYGIFEQSALSSRIALDLVTTGMAILWCRYNPATGTMLKQPKIVNTTNEKGEIIGRKPELQPALSPDGQPVLDQTGQPILVPVMEYKSEGTIEVDLIHPATFFPDHRATKNVPPRWILICRHMPVSWGEEHFPDAEIKQDSRAEVNDPAIDLLQTEPYFLFCEYFEANSISNPTGAYCAFANFNTMLIPYQPLFKVGNIAQNIPDEGVYFPTSSGELPFVIYYRRFPHNEEECGIWTRSDFYDAIDYILLDQVYKSSINNYIEVAAKMPLFVPQGQGIKESLLLTEMLGKVYSYDPQAGGQVYMPSLAPILPQMMQTYLENKQELEDLLNIRRIDYGMPEPSVRTTGQMQMQVDLSNSAKQLEARYNEGQDFKFARIITSLINYNYSIEKLKDILGENESILLTNINNPKNCITDPKNVKIERGSRSKETKPERQRRIMFAMQQNPESFNPENKPWILEELEFPGGKEAFERIDLEKKYVNWKIDQLLTQTEGWSAIQPLPGENIPLQLDMMIKALYGKILSGATNVSPAGKQALIAHIVELSKQMALQRVNQLIEQLAMASYKNTLPVTPFEFDEQGNVKKASTLEAINKKE